MADGFDRAQAAYDNASSYDGEEWRCGRWTCQHSSDDHCEVRGTSDTACDQCECPELLEPDDGGDE